MPIGPSLRNHERGSPGHRSRGPGRTKLRCGALRPDGAMLGSCRLSGSHEMSWEGPMFIVGMPRSGTKLLRGLLDQHPRIRILQTETEFLPFLSAWVDGH